MCIANVFINGAALLQDHSCLANGEAAVVEELTFLRIER